MKQQIPPHFIEVSPGYWTHPSNIQGAPQTHAKAPPRHPKPLDTDTVPIGAVTIPKRIRQSTKPLLNKLEGEFLSHIQDAYSSHIFHAQAVRFKLGNGIWYKPDFVCWSLMECWEVKGPHAFRGGFENLKVAAHQYPQIKWTLVWKEGDQWKEQVVLP